MWKVFKTIGWAALSLSMIGVGHASEYPLKMVTGSSGGAWWTFAASLAEASKQHGLDISTQTGQTIPNIILVDRQQADVGITYSAFSGVAGKGSAPFKEPVKNVQAIATLDPNFLMVVTNEKFDAKSFAEVAAKKLPMRIAIHPKGSMPYFLSLPILDAYGISENALKSWGGKFQVVANHGEAASLMSDGHIDGWMFIATFGHPVLTEMATTRNLQFFSFDEQVLKKVGEELGLTKFVVPANSFKGQNRDIATVGASPVIIVGTHVPDDVVYKFTKTLYEEMDRLAISGLAKPFMKVELMSKNTGFALHPGAARYYREVLK